ncbi:ATP-binding cassette domain-containing protein [Marinovum sp. 2_MG-2023]|uniref:ATP-binding cassette domain-containing protein n=1 Tax=unclassified Marinovum TaxID=2647166 RepID=UPI0026E13E88|nr:MULTISPECIES: ATP-binding cassette domain-containing protein [unclassified Marinovum]MDO6732058.1 ATP-binding cassette domain-containing protein [Marinovum sp. 2_MG-2023]MDO6781373.1 ATP-binding cassette domain-containing protein [Marinovum sp. 1_MG-2023]
MVTLFPVTLTAARAQRHGKTLVGPIDLGLDGAGVTAVIGPNGAGKTTFLRLLHGTERLCSGTIRWHCSTEEARHHQAFVFQHPVMLRRTVLQNLCYPLTLRGTPRRAAEDQARDWAARIGLGDMLDRPAPMLSGGERQKLALARAMITDPALLFLDEPCAALDGRATREIEEILHTAKSKGMRLILATHNMGQARRLADDVVFLLRGRVHETGTATDFFNQPATPQAKAFLEGDIVE